MKATVFPDEDKQGKSTIEKEQAKIGGKHSYIALRICNFLRTNRYLNISNFFPSTHIYSLNFRLKFLEIIVNYKIKQFSTFLIF